MQEAALPSRDNDGAGLQVGRNSYLQASWLPPDPPPGHGVHRYAFQVFALEAGASFDGEPGREAVLEAIRDHGLASGCLIGTYERPDTSISVGDEEGVPVMLPATSPSERRGPRSRSAAIAGRLRTGRPQRLIEQIVLAVAARILDRQQAPLGRRAARRRKAAELAARSDDPVAGHDDRKGIAAERLADLPGRGIARRRGRQDRHS